MIFVYKFVAAVKMPFATFYWGFTTVQRVKLYLVSCYFHLCIINDHKTDLLGHILRGDLQNLENQMKMQIIKRGSIQSLIVGTILIGSVLSGLYDWTIGKPNPKAEYTDFFEKTNYNGSVRFKRIEARKKSFVSYKMVVFDDASSINPTIFYDYPEISACIEPADWIIKKTFSNELVIYRNAQLYRSFKILYSDNFYSR